MNPSHVSPRTVLTALLAALVLAITAWLVVAGLPGLAERTATNGWHKTGDPVATNGWHVNGDVRATNGWHVVQR